MPTDSGTGRASGKVIPKVGAARKGIGAWARAWRRSAASWESLAPRIASITGWKVWNPGRYGERWHASFRRTYPLRPRPILILGLNPGPYGMAQTGIPFTDIKRLRERLPAAAGAILRRAGRLEIPGLAPRSLRPFLGRTFESSSVRVYRFLDLGWGSAEEGWRHVAVANPCTLLFMDGTGKNRTPADLASAGGRGGRGRDAAHEIRETCDRLRRATAREAMEAVHPRGVILLGKDVGKALGEQVVEALGASAVVTWEHPARAVPEKWAQGLLAEIQRRGWK